MTSDRAQDSSSPVVVIASANRARLLRSVMEDVRGLDWPGLRRMVSVPDRDSLPDDADFDGWEVVTGTRGLAAQRNAALDRLPPSSIVFFFDDDAVIRSDYVRNAIEFFERHPRVVGLTGRVLLDGAVSGEVSEEAADEAIQRSTEESDVPRWRRTRELYGCNFAVRTAAAPDLRFDARLPLYSWLEDHDFARRLMPFGSLAKVDACVIVHRAAASGGRQAHERLGYSQVMNPFYLWRKGSFPTWLMLYETIPRLGKNLLSSAGGPERAWRRRRLAGNAVALRDIARGRVSPERIVDL